MNVLQKDWILCPNCLDAYRLPMPIPLPDIRNTSGCVAQGFVREIYVREDLRVEEEGVGIKSEP